MAAARPAVHSVPNPIIPPLASPLMPPLLPAGDARLAIFQAVSGGSGAPANALTDADGNYLTDADGNYLIWSE